MNNTKQTIGKINIVIFHVNSIPSKAANTKKTTTVNRNEIRDYIFLENTNIYLGTFTLEMIAEFSANAVIPELVDSL